MVDHRSNTSGRAILYVLHVVPRATGPLLLLQIWAERGNMVRATKVGADAQLVGAHLVYKYLMLIAKGEEFWIAWHLLFRVGTLYGLDLAC